jgi:hypothetical protein
MSRASNRALLSYSDHEIALISVTRLRKMIGRPRGRVSRAERLVISALVAYQRGRIEEDQLRALIRSYRLDASIGPLLSLCQAIFAMEAK